MLFNAGFFWLAFAALISLVSCQATSTTSASNSTTVAGATRAITSSASTGQGTQSLARALRVLYDTNIDNDSMQATVSSITKISQVSLGSLLNTQTSIEPQAVSKVIASSSTNTTTDINANTNTDTNTNTNHAPMQTTVSNSARSSHAFSERLPDSQILSDNQISSTSAVGSESIQTGVRSQSDLSSSLKSTSDRIASMPLTGPADIQVSSNPQSASAFVAGLTDSVTNISSNRSLTSSLLQPPMPQRQGIPSSTVTNVSQSTLISGLPIISKASNASSGNYDDSIGTTEAPTMTAMVHPFQKNGNRSSSIPSGPNIDSVTRPAAATNSTNTNTSSTALLSSRSITSQAIRYRNSTFSLSSGASSTSVTSRAFNSSNTTLDSSTSSSGANNSAAVYSASSATLDGHSTTNGSTATSSLPSDAAPSKSEQAGGPAIIFLLPVSGKSRGISTHLSVGGNSTLSTFIVPANASDSSSQADVSSADESSERPAQNSEPNIRLATSRSGSLSTAGDDEQAHGSPAARPAATRSQARSTTGDFNGKFSYRPHQKPPEYHNVAQSTPVSYQYGSASGERSTVSIAQSVSQSEGQPGEASVNGPSSSSSESLSGRSAVVTTTESYLTAAATASLDVTFTSIIGPDSTALQTSKVPAVVYTTTNPQGPVAVISSAVVPSNSAVVPSNAAGAAGQTYASLENDRPESPIDSFSDNQNNAAAGSPQSVHPSGETPNGYPAAQNPARPQSESQSGETSESQDASEDRPQLIAGETDQSHSATEDTASVNSDYHSGAVSIVEPIPAPEGRPNSNTGKAGEADQSIPAAENAADAKSGDHSGAVSNVEPVPAPEGQPNFNSGEGEQAGQPDSAQNSNGGGGQDYEQNPSEPESDSSSTTTATSHASGSRFPAPSNYNASNLKFASGYGLLASSGLPAPAENASTRFVQRRMVITKKLSEYSPNTLLYYN